MNSQRKYFRSSIHELREICNSEKDNETALKDVFDELQHRKTPGAVELRDKLEAHFAKGGATKKTNSSSSKQNTTKAKSTTKTSATGATKTKTATKAKPKSSDQSGYDEPIGISYDREFSLIDPEDKAKSQNTKWSVKLREDEKYILSTNKDSDLLDKQIDALGKFIEELKSTGRSNSFITLSNGVKLKENPSINIYRFTLEDAIELFEGASVEITIANKQATAKVTSLLDSSVILEFDDDHGSTIQSCTVKVDRTQLLRALSEKLIKVRAGDTEDFNFELAEKVFNNSGKQKQPELKKNVKLATDNQKLNKEQSDAVCSVLTNENSYIWGPPGTGKTFTLGLLVENFFAKEERSLIVSNTNQAVDQVLLKLCQVLGKNHKAVKDGFILRRGKIDLAELDEEWGEFIDLDSIVAKKSKVLKEKEADLESKLTVFRKKAEKFETALSIFQTIDEKTDLLDDANRESVDLQNQKSNLSQNIKLLESEKTELLKELDTFRQAGAIRRAFMRSQQNIGRDITNNEIRLKEHQELSLTLPKSIKLNASQIKTIKADISQLKMKVKDESREACRAELEKISKKTGPLEAKLAEVRSEIEGIKDQVLANAKVIGATVTRTFLRKSEYINFDNVIVDEASMVILPALYNVAGLASKRCIISGDFRQIPPIVETKQKGIFEEIGQDVFHYSGIEQICREGKKAPNLTMLTQQYRMRKEICELINPFMYHGQLVTAELKLKQDTFPIIPEINKNILIIDTSKIFPFAQKKGTSYYNLMHAIAARNLINIITTQPDLKGKSVGVCAPYAAQAKMHHAINRANQNVTAGTVHRFQGDEKDIMIIDTVDSLGDAQVGFWALADLPHEDGCKLWNVGISRAKDYLIFIANLTHLNNHLPKPSFLRKVLYNAQVKGQVIEVEEILKLDKVKEDLASLQKTFELDSDTLEKGLFNNRDFEKVFLADIIKAKKSIGIFSGFITPKRVAHYGDLFRQKIASGVTIRCVTRPPKLNGSMKPALGKEALDALEAIGCIIDTRASIHQKAAIIDDEISWFGSLNPLSHTSSTEETMARIENKTFALQLSQNLAIKFMKDAAGSAIAKENPECDSCGYKRTSFHFGTYGRPDYWRCESCETIISVRKTAGGKKIKDTSFVGKPCPEECGGSLVIKEGRYGQFYSCNNFPKCRATLKV
jgi:superfamily I DNA and/or RNA helicase